MHYAPFKDFQLLGYGSAVLQLMHVHQLPAPGTTEFWEPLACEGFPW